MFHGVFLFFLATNKPSSTFTSPVKIMEMISSVNNMQLLNHSKKDQQSQSILMPVNKTGFNISS